MVLNDFEKHEVEPDHQEDVKNHAYMKDDVEESAIGEFVILFRFVHGFSSP